MELEDDLKMLFDVNVVANIHLFNLFIPLILKGKEKKVITISTGLADLEFTNNFEHEFTPLYSISKAAMNMAVAKFNAQYKKEGVLFMSVCPGMVDVGQFNHGMLMSTRVLQCTNNRQRPHSRWKRWGV